MKSELKLKPRKDREERDERGERAKCRSKTCSEDRPPTTAEDVGRGLKGSNRLQSIEKNRSRRKISS